MPLSTPVIAEHISGSIFIGTLFNVCLQGLITLQVFIYFTQYRSDWRMLKVLVSFLFVANLTHSVFLVTYLYNALINHLGDVQYLLFANWVFATGPALTGLIACAAQMFYGWRIFTLTGKKLVVGFVGFAAVLGCLASFGTAIYIHFVPKFVEFRKFKYMGCMWLISEAVCDIVITGTLIWYLRGQRKGIAATNNMINKLILVTLHTGLLTTLWALTEHILYLTYPSPLHLLFFVVVPKLYTVSLMSTLNCRARQTTQATYCASGSGTASSTYNGRKDKPIHLEVQVRSETIANQSSIDKGSHTDLTFR